MTTISIQVRDSDMAIISKALKAFTRYEAGTSRFADIPQLASMLLSQAAVGAQSPDSWEDTNFSHVLREHGYRKADAGQDMHPGIAIRLSEDWYKQTFSFSRFVLSAAVISVLIELGYSFLSSKLLIGGQLALSFYLVAFALSGLGFCSALLSHFLRFSPAYNGKVAKIPGSVRNTILWLSTKSYQFSLCAMWAWLAGLAIRIGVLLARVGAYGICT